jgi:hypothetical protein
MKFSLEGITFKGERGQGRGSAAFEISLPLCSRSARPHLRIARDRYGRRNPNTRGEVRDRWSSGQLL